MASLLIKNIGMLATACGDRAKSGKAQGEILTLQNAYVLVQDEQILEIGQGEPTIDPACEVIDAQGKLVTAGLVDAHTHLVFGGWRENELALKLHGVPYLDILAQGGGILSTVRSTRAASEDELFDKTAKALDTMLSLGTTTCEAKSGYGLDFENECKQLNVTRRLNQSQPVELVSTFMAAHALPEEYKNDREGYLSLVIDRMLPYVAEHQLAEYCDVFCETGVFTPEESRRILTAAQKLGLGAKIHADEIDPIGKKRDGGGLGGNDEREQTLNQLLTEMDGFDGKNGVVILAATNRPDSLDPALLRPGRFDRRIPVELPDLGGREAILKVHAKDVHMAADIDYNAVARATSGASGAELANIVNEAALRAVRMGRDVVEQADLEESVEVVIAGYQRKSAVISEQEKKIVAYHEIGHALVAAKQSDSAPVHKITIVPRTSGALGYTMQVEEGERFLMSREEAFNKLATLTGGRTAEELIFRSATTGASNDIEQATRLARAMVTRYGMSSRFGMVALETVENAYLGGDTSLACSQETAALVDREVVALVKDAQEKAREILTENTDALHRLSKYLLEKETITGEEFMQMLNERA